VVLNIVSRAVMLLFSGMRRARVSLLLVATFLFAATSECMAQDSSSETEPCPRVDIEYQQRSFVSGGKTIGVEQFQPAASGRFPIIVMIHGSGGLLTRRDAAFPKNDNFGEIRLACRGYVAVLVHYFDRSGILSTTDEHYMEAESDKWLETLRAAVDYASLLPKGDTARIGLFGESLGGYLALALAMQDTRIRAVVEYGGGIRQREGEDPKKLPPVMILHGDADKIVPPSEAARLAAILEQNGSAYQTRIFPGFNHYPSRAALAEVQEEAIRFFNEYLRRPVHEHKLSEDASMGIAPRNR